jgi:drug/metabolite transporter (DMT)-like permease
MVGAVQFSVTSYVITLTGIGWGILFFAEAHSLWIWASVAFIFAGLALVTVKQGTVTVRQPSKPAT